MATNHARCGRHQVFKESTAAYNRTMERKFVRESGMQRSKRRKLARLAAGKVATKAKAVRVYPFLTESEAKDRGGFTTTVQALGPLFNRAEARKLGLPLR